MDVKQQINEELNKFQTIRNQCKKILSQRGQLEIQLNENKLVKEVMVDRNFESNLIVYYFFNKRNWTYSKMERRRLN